jgi:nucleoside-diphosphate-sugar epimerase
MTDAEATPRRVVMTGAGGKIGTAITPLLPPDWDLRRNDRRPGCDDVLDITDLDACRAAFAGADAVVHLAAVPDPRAGWADLLPANVVGAHNVAAAAADAGVHRLVMAGSGQAVAGYPLDAQVRVGDRARPENLYGATKAWTEALGSWIAASTPTSVVVLRIGYFADRPPTGADATTRDKAGWLSPRDCAELVRSAVEAEGLQFFVAHGISANRYRSLDLTETCATLGYRPTDDSWTAG